VTPEAWTSALLGLFIALVGAYRVGYRYGYAQGQDCRGCVVVEQCQAQAATIRRMWEVINDRNAKGGGV
jgi:hypothetical protein